MEEIYLNLSQTTVFGKAAGDPENMLVLGIHGWSQRNGWHTWETMLEPLAGTGFYVLSVDMPGWGKSPAIDDSPLSVHEAGTIVIEILDELKQAKAVLMGKSWGGAVAVKAAIDYPHRISHLILTAPALRHYDQLKSMIQPVLLAWAEDDPVIPFANAQRFVEAYPRTHFVPYTSGGHSAAPNNAEDFTPIAANFLLDS